MTVDALRRDLVHAWRPLRRSPLYALVVTSTLGLAVGATTALFAIAYGVALEPLALPHPERVVALWETALREGYEKFRISPGNFPDYAVQNRVFESLAMFGAGTWQATGQGDPEQLQGAAVGPDYFRVLGVQPSLGRAFRPEDLSPTAEPVVILGHGIWMRWFGGQRDILGRSLRLDGRPYTIVGVMPDGVYPTWPLTVGGFNFLPAYQQLWTPFKLSPDFAGNRRAHVFAVIGRLRHGVGLEEAQRGLDEIAARLAREHPETNADIGVRLTPLADEVSGNLQPVLFTLLGAVTVALLAACANVANMALLRSFARRRELAVRAALGARRPQIVRLVAFESLLLALAGALLGVLFAWAGLRLLLTLAPQEMPRAAGIDIDAPVLVFAGLVAAVAAALIALAPALHTRSAGLLTLLRADARGSLGSGAGRAVRRVLIAFEIATAVVLVAGAALSARSFAALSRVDAGFEKAGVLAFEVSLPGAASRDPARIDGFQTRLLERLHGVAGVRAAAIGYDLPLETTWVDAFSVEGRPPAGPDEDTTAVLRLVSSQYFDALGIRLRKGRVFTDDDRLGREGVVVVNEAFARLVFPGQAPIGQHLILRTPSIMLGDQAASRYEVVGVVADVRSRGLDAAAPPAYYLPVRQFPQATMTVFAKTAGDPLALAAPVREAMRNVDPTLPVVNIQTLEAHVASALARSRFLVTVLVAFGGAALLLAAFGVYGLLAYAVEQRRAELAVRQVLGATGRDLVRLVLGEGAVLTGAGVAGGLLAALVAGRALRALLYTVAPTDPASLGAALLLIASAAALAATLPAWRASRVNASALLRGE